MINSATAIESLFEKAANYSKTTIELIKLTVVEKTATIISSIVAKLSIVVAILLFAFCVNIGMAFWIGTLLGEAFYGFFIIGGLYGIIALLLYIFRKQWIKAPVSNAIISGMTDKKRYEKN